MKKDKWISLLLAIVLQVKPALSLIIFHQILRNSDDVQIFQSAVTVILGDFNAQSKSWWSDD